MTSYPFKARAPLLRRASLAMGALLACTLAGCATSTTPEMDKTFGDSVRNIYTQQTLVPLPVQLQDTVTGVDGVAAVHSQQRYQDSFKEPAKTFDMLGAGGGR